MHARLVPLAERGLPSFAAHEDEQRERAANVARHERPAHLAAARLRAPARDLKLIIPPVFAAIVFVGAIFMCLAAAMISFRKVASIDPALVFRT